MRSVTQVLWFLDLVRRPVFAGGVEAGRVTDTVLRLEESGYPILTGVLLDVDGRSLFLPSDRIESITQEAVATEYSLASLSVFERRPGEVLIGRDLLDHHLIWSKSRLRPRLVTAKDVGFYQANGDFHAVAVALAPLHRSRWFQPKERGRTEANWNEVVPLVGHVPTARRRLELKSIRRLHPAQLADLLEQASEQEGQEIMGALQLDPEFEADVVEELNPLHRREALKRRSDEEVGELLGEMEPDDAVDLLLSLDQDRRANVLSLIPSPARASVDRLLKYHPESAGGMMTTDFISVPATATAGEICALIKSRSELPKNLWSIFLVDAEGKLSGQLPIVSLIAADSATLLEAVADLDPPKVMPDADVSEVAVTMADYNLAVLAVVDEEYRILGAVTVDDVLPRTLSNSWRRRQEMLEDR